MIAEAAWQEFSLRKVLFIPSGDTPNKDMHHINKNIRYAMVEKAIEGNGHFMISPIERDRQGPSYTVDTIRILQREFGDDYEFYFICGTDAVADLPNWKKHCRRSGSVIRRESQRWPVIWRICMGHRKKRHTLPAGSMTVRRR